MIDGLIIGFILGAVLADLYHFLFHRARDRRIVKVIIKRRRWRLFMPQVIEGQTDALKVIAKNKAGGVILPLPDGTVAVSVATDSVSAVDLATGNFTFTAGNVPGDDSLTATVATIASAAFVETVVADTTVASVEIQHQ